MNIPTHLEAGGHRQATQHDLWKGQRNIETKHDL